MQKKLFGSIDISSSQDPTKIAATVSGLILTVSSLIIFGAMQFFGVTLVDAQISAFATQAGLAAGALWTLFGVIRKVMNWMSW
mgnify:CR=1 FL=1